MLKKLFTKSIFYFILLAGSKLLAAVFWIILARFFLPEKLGVVVYFTTVAATVAAIFDFGLCQFYQKKMATRPHQWLFTQILVLRTILFIASGLLVIALHQFSLMSMPYLSWLVIYMLGNSLFCVADGHYLSRSQTLRIGVKNILRNLLLFALFIFIALAPHDNFFTSTLFAVIIITISNLAVLLFYFPYRILRFKALDISGTKMLDLLKKSWVYGVMDGSNVLYSRADSLVIQNALGSAALGIYGSAYRFLDVFNLLPQALFHNLFSFAAKENNISRRQLKTMVLTMAGFGLVAGGGLIFLSQPLIPWLLGEAYTPAVPIMQIFGVVVFLFFLNSPLHVMIQSSRYLKQYLPWIFGVVMLNLALNIILLPITGTILTAAWVLVGTQIVTIAVNLIFMRKLKLR